MDFQIEPTIVVNEFVFCERHGAELCHKCTYDHRFTNNYVLQDKLPEDFNENGNYDFDVGWVLRLVIIVLISP